MAHLEIPKDKTFLTSLHGDHLNLPEPPTPSLGLSPSLGGSQMTIR